MPRRGGGDAAVRRVIDQLFALTTEDADDVAETPETSDVEEDVETNADTARFATSSQTTTSYAPSVTRTVSALRLAYATEKYGDVRAAVVTALPKIHQPARFVLQCIEALCSSGTIGTGGDAEKEIAPSNSSSKKPKTKSQSDAPLIHLFLEALQLTNCVKHVTRPVFDAKESGTRLVDNVARKSAAELLARTFKSAVFNARGSHECRNEISDDFSDVSMRLEPRGAARLATVCGIDLEELHKHDPHPHLKPSVEHALHWYVGACLGGSLGGPAIDDKHSETNEKDKTSERKTLVTAAVSLVRHFSLINFATPSALDAFEQGGYSTLADGIAAYLPQNEREQYVRRLRDRTLDSRYSVSPELRAERFFRRLGLPPTFPDLDLRNEEEKLKQLCQQGKWDVADALAGEDTGLREAMRKLRLNGLISPNSNGTSSGTGSFLTLDVENDQVVFVDDKEGLNNAVINLTKDSVLGLDTEWRPDTARRNTQNTHTGSSQRSPTKKNPTALVQIAGECFIGLFDVPVLFAKCPEALCDAFVEILAKPREGIDDDANSKKNKNNPIVIGFGLGDDLKRLAKSYPGQFDSIIGSLPRTLCLQKVAEGGNTSTGAPVGLSSLSLRLLGHPLDKTETCSDWNSRPLTDSQITYAALDAKVLRLLLPKVLGVGSVEEAVEMVCTRDITGVSLTAPAVPSLFASDDLVPAQGEFCEFQLSRGRAFESTVAPLTPNDTAFALTECLVPLGIDPTPITLPKDTGPTALDTANALGGDVPVDTVVKSIGVLVSGEVKKALYTNNPCSVSTASVAAALGGIAKSSENVHQQCTHNTTGKQSRHHFILLLRGADRVDFGKVAGYLGVARRKVRLATPAECIDVFGYPPGSMPPVGLRDSSTLCLMDANVFTLGDADVYPGAGSPELVFKCPAGVLQDATDAEVVDITETNVAVTGSTGSSSTQTSATVAPSDEVLLKKQKMFVTDGSLGRLARWLRALGVDAEHVPAGAAGEYRDLLRLAVDENRIVLTKDSRLTKRREFLNVGVFLVPLDDPKEQLEKVSTRFGLTFQKKRLLTRCAKCNGPVEAKLSAKEVLTHPSIPKKVKAATSDFWRCGRCEKVYWIGPKSHLAVDFIEGDLRGKLAGASAGHDAKDLDDGNQEEVIELAARGDRWPRGESDGD